MGGKVTLWRRIVQVFSILRHGPNATTLVFGFVLSVCCNNAEATGFDCAKAKSAQEKLICMDYRLSDLDGQLVTIYRRALQSVQDASSLKTAQKQWIEERSKCKSVRCVFDAYVQRIKEIAPGIRPAHHLDMPSNQAWDFLPTPGYHFDSGFWGNQSGQLFLDQQPDEFDQPGTTQELSSGRVMPSERFQADRSGEKVPYLPSGEYREVEGRLEPYGGVQLGTNWLRAAGEYEECRSVIEDTGVAIHTDSPESGKRHVERRLLFIKPGEFTIYQAYVDYCPETALALHPLSAALSVVWFNSFYFFDSAFVIRFDTNLNTGSRLIGKTIYLGWANDIKELLGNQCQKDKKSPGKYYQCVDNKLKQVIKAVAPYYLEEDAK